METWFCTSCHVDQTTPIEAGWNRETGRVLCESCKGAGTYTIGDCEEGVEENCEECDGTGEVTHEN